MATALDTFLSAHGITNAQVSAALGISDGHVSDLRQGNKNLTVERASEIEALADKTGLVEAVVAERLRKAAVRAA